MRVLSLVLVSVWWFGCDGSDISDGPPIDTVDAAAGAIDSATPTIDGAPGAIDAAPATPDADIDRAQTFCNRYDTLCGYDPGSASRFDDEAACLAAFAGFDAAQRDCVEGELDDFEIDGMQQHCARATGAGPCG